MCFPHSRSVPNEICKLPLDFTRFISSAVNSLLKETAAQETYAALVPLTRVNTPATNDVEETSLKPVSRR